jgi:hypothetical protein
VTEDLHKWTGPAASSCWIGRRAAAKRWTGLIKQLCPTAFKENAKDVYRLKDLQECYTILPETCLYEVRSSLEF